MRKNIPVYNKLMNLNSKPSRRGRFNGVHQPEVVLPKETPHMNSSYVIEDDLFEDKDAQGKKEFLDSYIEVNRPRNKGGRPTKYNEQEYPRMAFIACSEMGAREKDLARLFDVAADSITEWKRRHDGFSLSIKNGRDVWDTDRAEKAFKSRVMGFDYVEEKIEEIVNVKELQYGEEWSGALKTEIRKRDKWTCQNPRCKSDNINQSEKQAELDVHHVDYNKGNSHPKNLIALCKTCHGSCHGKGNSSQRYWMNYYQKIMRNKAYDLSTTRLVPLVRRIVTTKKVIPDVMAGMFWLQNRNPERWKNVKYLGIKGEIGVKVKDDSLMDLNKFNREEKELFLELVRKATPEKTAV